jgi:hypothetical protein
MNFKADIGAEMNRQPDLERLVATALFRIGVESGSCDGVRAVLDAEHKVGAWFAEQTGRIRQSRQVFAQRLRFKPVGFELQPFRLSRLGAETIQQGSEFGVIWHLRVGGLVCAVNWRASICVQFCKE